MFLPILLATLALASASNTHTILMGCYPTPPTGTFTATASSSSSSSGIVAGTTETILDYAAVRHLVSDPRRCFEKCPSELGNVVSVKTRDGGSECVCSSSSSTTSSSSASAATTSSSALAANVDATTAPWETEDCTSTSWYVYQVVPSTQYAVDAAAAASKRDRTGMHGKRRLISGLCDGAERACKVAGMEAAYECIDTASSLQSCGACIAGEYLIGGVNQTVLGIDCTTLPGVDTSDVSCTRGECVVTSCLPDFQLVQGRCIRALD